MTAKDKVSLDITKYNGLYKLYLRDKAALGDVLKKAMTLAEYSLQRGKIMPTVQDVDMLAYIKQEFPQGVPHPGNLNIHIQKLEGLLGMSQEELVNQVIDAFTDFKGILSNHHSASEAKAMEVLKQDVNPLLASRHFTIDGKRLTPEEFFGGEKPNLKGLLQSLLYVGRYLSHVDLVHYLMLGQFHLVENMQNEHIKELLQIQPALKFQQENDITVGKRIEGTGFFDLGEAATQSLDVCPACKSPEWNKETFEGIAYCPACYGGGYK